MFTIIIMVQTLAGTRLIGLSMATVELKSLILSNPQNGVETSNIPLPLPEELNPSFEIGPDI